MDIMIFSHRRSCLGVLRVNRLTQHAPAYNDLCAASGPVLTTPYYSDSVERRQRDRAECRRLSQSFAKQCSGMRHACAVSAPYVCPHWFISLS